jgi:hypothetical protein
MDVTALFHHLIQLFFSSNHKYIPYNFYKEIQKALYRCYQYLVYFSNGASEMVAIFRKLHTNLYFDLIVSWFLNMTVFADSDMFYTLLFLKKVFNYLEDQ